MTDVSKTPKPPPNIGRQKRVRTSSTIFIGDSVVVAMCMTIAFYLRYVLNIGVVEGGERPELIGYILHYSAGFGLFFVLAWTLELYDANVTMLLERSVSRLIKVSLFWSVMFLGSSLVLKLNPPISRMFVGYACALMCLFMPAWRYAYLRFNRSLGRKGGMERRVLIVGCEKGSESFAEKFTANPKDPYKIAGFVSTRRQPKTFREDIPVLGKIADFDRILGKHDIDVVAVADTDMPHADILKVAKICENRFIEFNFVPGHFEVFTLCLGLKMIGTQPVLGIAELPQNHVFGGFLKRMIDIIGAFVGLAFTIPVIPILAVLIHRESPGPIIYRQIRTGRGGKPFTIYKFRSMKLSSEADGKARWCQEDDPRRLRIGGFMRKWNIDELPQFWNVLKGDMSLVGPRPERPELIIDFLNEIPHYQSRHSVRPGMTGWAQVNGLRGNTSLEERIRHDLQYIENWSLWLDIVIKFKTFFGYKNAY